MSNFRTIKVDFVDVIWSIYVDFCFFRSILTIFFTFCQYLFIFINICRFLSISVDFYQFLSIFINFCHLQSIFVSFCNCHTLMWCLLVHFVDLKVDFCQFGPNKGISGTSKISESLKLKKKSKMTSQTNNKLNLTRHMV